MPLRWVKGMLACAGGALSGYGIYWLLGAWRIGAGFWFIVAGIFFTLIALGVSLAALFCRVAPQVVIDDTTSPVWRAILRFLPVLLIVSPLAICENRALMMPVLSACLVLLVMLVSLLYQQAAKVPHRSSKTAKASGHKEQDRAVAACPRCGVAVREDEDICPKCGNIFLNNYKKEKRWRRR